MLRGMIVPLAFLASFSGAAVSDTTGFSVGRSTLIEVQEVATIEFLSVNSTERVSIYGADVKTVEKQECMRETSLLYLTLVFDEADILVNVETIYQGNVLASVQDCLDGSFSTAKLTPEEIKFFGTQAAKYYSDVLEVYMFYTGLDENTTRVSVKSVSDVD